MRLHFFSDSHPFLFTAPVFSRLYNNSLGSPKGDVSKDLSSWTSGQVETEFHGIQTNQRSFQDSFCAPGQGTVGMYVTSTRTYGLQFWIARLLAEKQGSCIQSHCAKIYEICDTKTSLHASCTFLLLLLNMFQHLPFKNFYTDDKNKLLYCWNHKVASSSFNMLFVKLTNTSALLNYEKYYR